MKYETYIFDFDETISQKLDIDWQGIKREVANTIGLKDADYSLTELRNKLRDEDREASQVVEQIVKTRELLSEETAKPVDKVVQKIIDIINRGHKYGIVSSNSSILVKSLMQKWGVEDIEIIGSSEANYLKPYPSGVLAILDRLQANKNTAIFIGNSKVDRQAAERSGIDFIHVDEWVNT